MYYQLIGPFPQFGWHLGGLQLIFMGLQEPLAIGVDQTLDIQPSRPPEVDRRMLEQLYYMYTDEFKQLHL